MKDKPYRDRAWLHDQYVTQQKSAQEIAQSIGYSESCILFYLAQLGIPRRTISEARAVKHWGGHGKDNAMYGRTGDRNPNWRGGICPERQGFYAHAEWKDVFAEAWARDGGQCVRCGKPDSGPRSIHVHHIVPVAVKEKRADLGNLALLCSKCHGFVHSKANVNREMIDERR